MYNQMPAVLQARTRSRRHEYNVTVMSVVKPLNPHAFVRFLANVIRAEVAATVTSTHHSVAASLLPPESPGLP